MDVIQLAECRPSTPFVASPSLVIHLSTTMLILTGVAQLDRAFCESAHLSQKNQSKSHYSKWQSSNGVGGQLAADGEFKTPRQFFSIALEFNMLLQVAALEAVLKGE